MAYTFRSIHGRTLLDIYIRKDAPWPIRKYQEDISERTLLCIYTPRKDAPLHIPETHWKHAPEVHWVILTDTPKCAIMGCFQCPSDGAFRNYSNGRIYLGYPSLADGKHAFPKKLYRYFGIFRKNISERPVGRDLSGGLTDTPRCGIMGYR